MYSFNPNKDSSYTSQLKPTRPSTETIWPESLPTTDETEFLSVTVCNTDEDEVEDESLHHHLPQEEGEGCDDVWSNERLVWTIHGLDDEGGVRLRTFESRLRLDKDVLKKADRYERLELLRANLPIQTETSRHDISLLHDFLCLPPITSSPPPTYAYASATTPSESPSPPPPTPLTIYLLSTNALSLSLLTTLFRTTLHPPIVPVSTRIFHLKTTDFFLSSERENLRLAVDRCARLRGSAHVHGFPAMVWEFGREEIRAVAAGWDGKLLGESVGCGLWRRVECLGVRGEEEEGVKCLTEEGLKEVVRSLGHDCADQDSSSGNRYVGGKKIVKAFGNDNITSVVGAALSEVSNHARYAYRVWIKKVGPPERRLKLKTTAEKRHRFNFCKQNYSRTCSIAGSERNLLQRLLKKNHGGMIERPLLRSGLSWRMVPEEEREQKQETVAEIPVTTFGHLASYGIHNAVLRLRRILLKEGEDVLKDFITCSTMKYAKTRPTSSKNTIDSYEENKNEIKKKKEKKKKSKNKTEKSGSKKKSEKKRKPCCIKTTTNESSKKSKSNKSKKTPTSSLFDDPLRYHGKYIMKWFGEGDDAALYKGKIVSHTEGDGLIFWRVVYEDGDEEDMYEDEVKEGLELIAARSHETT